ncbi:hypothetical protein [Actinomadura rudentiformis]|uniref:Uncharacterized protein n=1 Tax=Actinomadura rudentiformis TaxID=359158 RepID=A0A6H9YX06_9ACTN|nr:hypothetical protein [Actinomadura rudentiformis]KAB2351767.1 hypothetical protein F8566_06030 [Actinomadura rudentiformis]
MTERSHGAPDPVEPSMSGAPPTPGSPTPAPPSPEADLSAVRRTDALFDDLAARRTASCEPAVRLLHALVADVDAGLDIGDATGPDSVPDQAAREAGGNDPATPGGRRRGSRTFVALGVVGVVLTSTGVAAAGGRLTHDAAPAPQTPQVSDEPLVVRLETKRRPPSPGRAPVTGPVAPAQGRPGVKGPEPDPVRRRVEDLKRKLEDLLPPKHRRQGHDDWPFQTPKAKDEDDTRKKLDDIRRQAQKRLDRHRDRDGR